MDTFERVWIDYAMPILGILICLDTVFRRRVRDPVTLFFTVVLAAGSILMGINTLSKLGLF
jgi:hypothetical protein